MDRGTTVMQPRNLLAAALVALAGPAVAADLPAPSLDDPILLRKHIMSNVGGAMKLAVPMVKGEAPYDPRVAVGALRVLNTAALGFAGQFPAGSDTGHETEASPKIWTERAEFDAKLAKFVADTSEAVKTEPADLDAFRPVFATVAENCKSCHEAFRVKKN